jgi:hypothetical protein
VTITATPPSLSSNSGSDTGAITTSCAATVPKGGQGTTQSCSYQLYYLSYGVDYTITASASASASGYTPSPTSATFTPMSSSPTETQDFSF